METQKDKKLLSSYAIGKTVLGRTNSVPFVVIILSCVKVNFGSPAIALCWQKPAALSCVSSSRVEAWAERAQWKKTCLRISWRLALLPWRKAL